MCIHIYIGIYVSIYVYVYLKRTAPSSWGTPRGKRAPSTHQSHTCGESTLLKGQHETSNTARSTIDV